MLSDDTYANAVLHRDVPGWLERHPAPRMPEPEDERRPWVIVQLELPFRKAA